MRRDSKTGMGLVLTIVAVLWTASLVSTIKMSEKAPLRMHKPDIDVLNITTSKTRIAAHYGVVRTVTLHMTGVAEGDHSVNISKDDPLLTPTSVIVPDGQDHVDFNITAPGYFLDHDQVCGIYASYSGSPALMVTMTATPLITDVILDKPGMVGGSGKTITGHLNCEDAPSTDVVVSLSDNNPNTTIDSCVTVHAGQTTSDNFTIYGNSAVSTPAVVTVTATAPDNANRTAQFNLNPAGISGFALSSTSALGGAAVSGIVTMNGPVVGDRVIALTSSNAGLATVPASVTVLDGASTANFPVTVNSVTTGGNTSISPGKYAKTLKVLPLRMTSVSWDTTTIANNGIATGTIHLNAPAPAGGVNVFLLITQPAFLSIGSPVVHVDAGNSTADFGVTGHNVAPLNRTSTVLVSFFNKTLKQIITVTP